MSPGVQASGTDRPGDPAADALGRLIVRVLAGVAGGLDAARRDPRAGELMGPLPSGPGKANGYEASSITFEGQGAGCLEVRFDLDLAGLGFGEGGLRALEGAHEPLSREGEAGRGALHDISGRISFAIPLHSARQVRPNRVAEWDAHGGAHVHRGFGQMEEPHS